mgnify:CR=1 FL=1
MMVHSSACDCEASLCETLRGFSAQHPDSVIYQTSLMSALLSGVYEGETTIADLLAHGDFGLGTFNELDGEMIAFSSQVYQLRADGSARAAKPEQKTPFAVMTWFQPQYRKTFDAPVSRQQIHDVIDQQIPSDNLFCALRIDGNFRHAHAGYHEHFITDDRQGGGHLLDYQLESGVLTFGEIHKLMIDLPADSAFLQANLHPSNLDAAIRSVEN